VLRTRLLLIELRAPRARSRARSVLKGLAGYLAARRLVRGAAGRAPAAQERQRAVVGPPRKPAAPGLTLRPLRRLDSRCPTPPTKWRDLSRRKR